MRRSSSSLPKLPTLRMTHATCGGASTVVASVPVKWLDAGCAASVVVWKFQPDALVAGAQKFGGANAVPANGCRSVAVLPAGCPTGVKARRDDVQPAPPWQRTHAALLACAV